MTQLSLAKDRIRILLLEGVHDNAVEAFTAAGYTNVERLKTALDGDRLARLRPVNRDREVGLLAKAKVHVGDDEPLGGGAQVDEPSFGSVTPSL